MKKIKFSLIVIGFVLTSNVFATTKPESDMDKPDKPDKPSVPSNVFMKPDDEEIGDVPGSSCPPQVSIGTPADVEQSKPKPSDDVTKPDGGSISQ